MTLLMTQEILDESRVAAAKRSGGIGISGTGDHPPSGDAPVPKEDVPQFRTAELLYHIASSSRATTE
jgi:hypothetical protein